MNYKNETKKIIQEYGDKFHIIFKDQKAVEDFAYFAFMKGYDKGLDFILNNRKV